MTAPASSSEETGAQARFAPWFVRFRQQGRGEPELTVERLDDVVDHIASTAVAGSVRAVFRGRLDRRAELRTQLGFGDANGSDAELVLAAYRRWGRDLLRHLRGVFALFFWDGERDCLLCARDPHGIEPLFYARAGEDVVFAPSPTTLLQQPGVSNRPNRAALAEFILRRWPVYEDTCHEAVRRVRLGHVLVVTNGTVSSVRAWHPSLDLRDHGWIDERELGAFDGLFERAVYRCVETGPSGVLLSGGIDSVSVAAVAVDVAQRRSLETPVALSLLFPGRLSERDIQVGVASSLGMPQLAVDLDRAVGSKGLVASGLEQNATWPWPTMFLWSPAYDDLVRAGVDRGIRVVLTGGGGDEWLAVDRSASADFLEARQFRALYEFLQAKRRSYEWPLSSLLRLVLWQHCLRPVLRFHALEFLGRHAPELLESLRSARHKRHFDDQLPAWLAPDAELRATVRQRCLDALSRADREAAETDLGRGFRYYLSDGVSLDHSLTSFDQEDAYERGRRAGVEHLHPYLEPDLVSFLFRVPPGLLMQGGREKGLVRTTIAKRFPALGFEQQRKVMATGLHYSIIRREGPAAWRQLGGCDALAEFGIAERRGVESFVNENLSSPDNRTVQRVWDLIKLESWVRGLV
jgi:asparagine synthase (glutamine-hydrolysing)